MDKTHVFGVILVILSGLVAQSHEECYPNIDKYIGKCYCQEGTIICKNQEKYPNKVGLKSVFRSLSDFVSGNNLNKTLQSLVIVESRDLYESLLFDEIQFYSIEIFESNLTSIDKSVFLMMEDTLKYLHIKSSELKNFTDAIKPLASLETLYLTLGLDSIRTLGKESIQNLPNLGAILLDGVVSRICTDAIHSLPSLERIRINNQLETIESNAINLTAGKTSTVIDLSNNRLTNRSFEENFIVSNTGEGVTLILSDNEITTLPMEIFMPFLEANVNNKIEIYNNPFLCGNCESEWTVKQFKSDRIVGLTCANQPTTDPWKFVWSCREPEQKPSSANLLAYSNVSLLALLFIASVFLSI